MKTVVRVSSYLALSTLLIGVCMGLASQFQHKLEPPGFKKPVLSIEMATTRADVERVVGDAGDSDRFQMRGQQLLDFLFIPSYWIEFLLISCLLAHRKFRGAKYLGLVAGLCATLAAWFDLQEDRAILHVLDLRLTETPDAAVSAISYYATRKWLLLFVAIGLLSSVFISRKNLVNLRWLIFLPPGVLFLITAVIGLIGLFNGTLLELYVLPMTLGSLLLFVALLWPPEKLLEGL
jgi:phage shock protein PspC (stress-responsive transcriptional regulator)